jgi:hypothetical protein
MEQVGQGKGIYAALAQANRAIGAIAKNRKNKEQNFNFRGIDDIMNAVHSAMSEAGVIILCEPEGETQVQERKTKAGSAIYHLLQKWRFQFCAEDGSSVSASFIGEALDMGDKAMNKSSSIALKYVLLQMFLIPTEEQADADPDMNSHELQPAQAQPRPAQAQPQRAGFSEAQIRQVADECFARSSAFISKDEFARLRQQMEAHFGVEGKLLPPLVKEAMRAGYVAWDAKQQQNAAEGSQE